MSEPLHGPVVIFSTEDADAVLITWNPDDVEPNE